MNTLLDHKLVPHVWRGKVGNLKSSLGSYKFSRAISCLLVPEIMNLTLEGERPDKDSQTSVQYITFNQDYSSIAIGTKSGYDLFTLENDIDQLQRTFRDIEHTDICIVERLFSSSLVVIVSLLSPRKLRLYHIKKKTEISIHSYTNTILSVKLNRKRLVICLEDRLYIHSLKDDLSVKWVIRNTPPNPNGLFALSPREDRCYIAYPATQRNGEVQIFDAIQLKNKILIPAHDNPLASLSFNQQSTMLASASEKGTVIRVHNIDDGQCLYEFRRGYARCVDIYSLSFSLDSLFLAASSSTETVHVFKLNQTKDEQSELLPNQSTWGSYLGRALVQSSTYISSHVSDMLHQWRSFATCRLPFKQLKNVCAITTIDRQPRVLVVSAEGYLYIYDLDINEGGDCILVKQHRLEEPESLSFRYNSKQGVTGAFANTHIHHHNNENAHLSSERGSNASTDHASGSSSNAMHLDTTHHYDNEFPPLDQQIQQIGTSGVRTSLARNTD